MFTPNGKAKDIQAGDLVKMSKAGTLYAVVGQPGKYGAHAVINLRNTKSQRIHQQWLALEAAVLVQPTECGCTG